MDIKEAIERNLAFKTEYGAGPRVLGGLYNRRFLKRKRYSTGGKTREDEIHERELKLGPLRAEHRSTSPKLIGNNNYEASLTLFGLFGVTTDKDYWVRLRLGPSLGVLGVVPAPPAALAKNIIDCEVTARTGLRFNLSGFIRDLRDKEADAKRSDPSLWDTDEEN